MTYYNTNRESGAVLADSRIRAWDQKSILYRFFLAHPGELFAPHEVHNVLFGNGTPLTSTRRAISDLTDAGQIEKTAVMRAGTFGKQVHTWVLGGTYNAEKVAV